MQTTGQMDVFELLIFLFVFQNVNVPPAKKQLILSKEAFTRFQQSFPKIINESLAETQYLESPEFKDRIKKMAEYHTLERVQVQGQLTILAYEMLEEPENINEQSFHQANVLAWCVEMLQSYFLIVDDIEDEAETRYGKPCWHTLPNVGTLALNDTSIFRSLIFEILRQNLSQHVFHKMSNLFNEAYLRSEYGQYLDAITAQTKSYNNFTPKLYSVISNNKFTFYSAKFPILVGLVLSNKANAETFQCVDEAFRDIGIWIQMNNDIMDWCDSQTTGKCNTDIQKGKCSWLAVATLQRCNSTQRDTFLTCYGKPDGESVEKIRKLYVELGLHDIYCKEQRERYENIMKQIRSLPENSIPAAKIFHTYVEKIYPFIVGYPQAQEYDKMYAMASA